jgi:hypothetical protein
MKILNKIKNTEFYQNWAKAFAVCYPMMVEGDLSALTFTHFWKANVTGIIAATLATLTKKSWYKSFVQHKYALAIILGVCTFVADLLVHPTHFGAFWTEALATGVGAGLLSAFFIYKPLGK